MENQFTPTKANLIKAKENLLFSRGGYSLLDKKRTVLIREAMTLVDRANEIQKKVKVEFERAYDTLQIANITLGVNNVADVAMSIPKQEEFQILYRSVMGIEIPMVVYKKDENRNPNYSFFRTNAALDNAVRTLEELKYLVYELAEIENAVFKISLEIKKTVKRANALEKIQIPKYEEAVKYISDVLEEKEREDFFRLKKVKSKKQEKAKQEKENQNQ